ncbi:MAG TPA: ATP-binding protein [Pyrinomonadaceae bacterium]|nr:ATP-binding protein [Pyrinomonadaceae bacterium]
MATKPNKTRRVLGRVPAELFAGRAEQLRELTGLASARPAQSGLVLLAAPHAGLTELLRQAFDEMFRHRGGPAPVYFNFTHGEHGAAAAARRFLHSFLAQLAAHRREDPALVTSPPPLGSLTDLFAPVDYEWADELVRSVERAGAEGDERTLIRLCLSAPAVAAQRGSRTVLLLDDVHAAERLKGEVELGPEVAQAAFGWGVPFALGGLRRRLFDVLNGAASHVGLDALRRVHVAALKEAEAGELVERLAAHLSVPVTNETRDLLVQQAESNPYLITSFVQAARGAGVSLNSFREFQQLYVDELLGGRVNRRFSAALEEVATGPVLRRGLLRVLHESAANAGGKSPVELWLKRLGLDPHGLDRLMRELHARELANFHATHVEVTPGLVWRDYLRVSYRLQVAAEPRALVVADTLIETLKRAPQTMARHYRREAALKLVELLRRFNFQHVPASLLHYDRFAKAYRGLAPDEAAAGLAAESETLRLPQVVHSASCASFYPPIAQVCDEERCAVGHGFDSTSYADSDAVVWIAAEVESKLEAGRALTEVWLDRLAQVSAACGFENARLWLVVPEGFSAEAVELLRERGAYGSSRRQLELLTTRLGGDAGDAPGAAGADEFAVEIPMGEDTELIAAHAAEQIARRMEFRTEQINQIKTALVEACINASEHSLSPERKIYNRFRVEDDKLTITVSSRGLSVPAEVSANGSSTAEPNGHDKAGGRGRRGWGLKLIRTLMDDVEFEQADDGTRLRMTKYLRREKGSLPQ